MNCNWLGRWGNTNSWIRTFLFLCTTIKAKSHLCTKTWNLVLQKHKCVHSQQHSVARLSLTPRGQILPKGPPAALIWWSTPGIPPAPPSDSHAAPNRFCWAHPWSSASSASSSQVFHNSTWNTIFRWEASAFGGSLWHRSRALWQNRNWTKASRPPSQTLGLWQDRWDLVQVLVPKMSSSKNRLINGKLKKKINQLSSFTEK